MNIKELEDLSIVSTSILNEIHSKGCTSDCSCYSYDEVYHDEPRNSGKTTCRCDSHCSCDSQCSCDSHCSCENNCSKDDD